MSVELDVVKLRALAEALPRETWTVDQPEDAGGWHVVCREDGTTIDKSGDGGFEKAMAEFIAACSPAAILALLDKLAAEEASDKESIEMYRRVRDSRDALQAHLLNEALTETTIQKMRCTECGHEYVIEGIQAPGRRYFGSAYDFCPECEGAPEPMEG